jgi:hypothetical protein
MEVIPKFEVGMRNGKIASYKQHKYLCRLFIPIHKDKVALEWLQNEGCTILMTYFQDSYFSIIFSTSNKFVLKKINRKYKFSKISERILLNRIQSTNCSRSSEDYHDEYYNYDSYEEYDLEIQRDLLEDQLDYSESVANSSDTGWLYSDPDYQDYRQWSIYDEPEYGYEEEG